MPLLSRTAFVISCTICVTAVAHADFAAGVAAYEKKDYAAAAREWEPLARSGDAAAQFNLGLLYLDGQGKPQNFSEAVLWFRRAADQGYGKAQLNLGAMYGSGRGVKRDWMQAYKWLSICAAWWPRSSGPKSVKPRSSLPTGSQ